MSEIQVQIMNDLINAAVSYENMCQLRTGRVPDGLRNTIDAAVSLVADFLNNPYKHETEVWQKHLPSEESPEPWFHGKCKTCAATWLTYQGTQIVCPRERSLNKGL